MSRIPLRHGGFLPPFHPLEENQAACLDRDPGLMAWRDRPCHNPPRIDPLDRCAEHRDEPTAKRSAAAPAMFDRHAAEPRAAQAAW